MSYLNDFKRMAMGRELPGLNEGVEHDDFSRALVNGVRAARGESPKVEAADDMEIAKTIAMQMGGKMKAMLGATLSTVPQGLKIKWPQKKRSLGNVCVVTLRPDDTYDMEFFNGDKSVKKFEGIYAEALKPTFEKHTGWYLTL